MRYFVYCLLLIAGSCSATTFFVTSNADSAAAGTLRSAITLANADTNSPHTIRFQLGNPLINLTSVLPTPTRTLTLDGVDVPGLTLDAQGGSRVIAMSSTGSLTLRRIGLRNGFVLDAFGGCVYSGFSSVTLQLDRATFTGCTVGQSGSPTQLGGGAVSTAGPLLVYDSVFTDNLVSTTSASARGGAIQTNAATPYVEGSQFIGNRAESTGPGASAQAGAIDAGRLRLLQSELINNVAQNVGNNSYCGAVCAVSDNEVHFSQNLFLGNRASIGAAFSVSAASLGVSGSVRLLNNTIAGNLGGSFGVVRLASEAIFMKNNSFWKNSNSLGGAAHLYVTSSMNSIDALSNNLFAPTANGEAACAVFGLQSGATGTGFNLFTDTSCNAIAQFSLVLGPDSLRIRGLRRTGNTYINTPVLEMFAGSANLDAGNADTADNASQFSCASVDARDEDRPWDADPGIDSTPVCDIGATEWTREASLFADGMEALMLR